MLRVLSLFSGIGAFETALNEEDIDWELDHYCEIDKYACQSYNMVHGTCDDDNLKDVTNIDYSKIGHIDLLTYGFPCQDISLAGQQKGFVDEDGNVTRSGLFFSAADIIRHTNPKFAIFENVKNLTSKKFKAEFETVLTTLDELGYNTYWKVLNAKDYGIPQNRERVFGISVRKDIDHGFKFPDGFPLKLRLKDMLEDNVDEKYYLSQKGIDYFKKQAENRGEDLTSHNDRRMLTLAHGQSKGANKTDDICPTLDTQFSNNWHGVLLEPKVQQVGNIVNTGNWSNPQRGRIYSPNGISPTLNCMQGGGLEPKIIEPHMNIPENTKKGYKEAYEGDGVYINRPHQKRGTVQHGMIQTLKTGQDVGVVVKDPSELLKGTNYDRNFGSKGKLQDGDGVCGTLQAAMGCGGGNVPITLVEEKTDVIIREEPLEREGWHRNAKEVLSTQGVCRTLSTQSNNLVTKIKEPTSLRIRKLTPRECWRLMGFKDRYFDRVHGVSNTQLYKQAGNSIVVDVLRAIFREFKEQYPDDFQDWEGDL